MYWTKDQPTKPGWYWQRDTRPSLKEAPTINYIRYYDGKLCIMNWEIPNENIEWAGPIPEPKKRSPI